MIISIMIFEAIVVGGIAYLYGYRNGADDYFDD